MARKRATIKKIDEHASVDAIAIGQRIQQREQTYTFRRGVCFDLWRAHIKYRSMRICSANHQSVTVSVELVNEDTFLRTGSSLALSNDDMLKLGGKLCVGSSVVAQKYSSIWFHLIF